MFEEFGKGYGYTLGKVAAYVTALMMINTYVGYKVEALKKAEEEKKSDK